MSNILHFEDFEVGQKFSFGHYEVSKDEIVEFAARFDPQPHHLDEEAGKEPDLPRDFVVKIRYRHAGAPARVMPPEKGQYRVCFQEPQLAVTPGQFAVFYNGDEVVGGGEIL